MKCNEVFVPKSGIPVVQLIYFISFRIWIDAAKTDLWIHIYYDAFHIFMGICDDHDVIKVIKVINLHNINYTLLLPKKLAKNKINI